MAAGRGSINDPSLRSEDSGQTPHDFNRICRRNGLAKNDRPFSMIRAKRNAGQGTTPGDGEKAPSKGELARVRYASPHGRRDKAPPTEHCRLLALPKRSAVCEPSARGIGRWRTNKSLAKKRRATHTKSTTLPTPFVRCYTPFDTVFG